MCGIAGFNWCDKRLAKKMGASIKHRGPDDDAFYTDKKVSLCQKRLSIIDLRPGLYPLHNESGSMQLLFNGEIYNYEKIRSELRKKGHRFHTGTDAEVIVHAYEESGPKCLEKLNGCFSLCLYDSNRKALFLARDRLGIKPLYYYFDGKKLIFASEIKSILEHPIKREVNKTALDSYFARRYVSTEETIFKGIKRVLPGHFLFLDLKTLKLQNGTYWNLSTGNALRRGERFFSELVFNNLKEAVKRRLISDVPLGAYLSGGIDSSSIVGMMSLIKKLAEDESPTRTFSVAFEHGEESNELAFAKEVSDHFGTDHTEFVIKPDIVKVLPRIVWHFDEPFADPAAVPVYELSRRAKKHVTVVLTGDGGDELFAGYDHYKFLSLGNKLRHVPHYVKGELLPNAIRKTPARFLDRVYKYSSSMGEQGFERIARFLVEVGKNNAKAHEELLGIFDEAERKVLFTKNVNEKSTFSDQYAIDNKKYFGTKGPLLTRAEYYDVKNLLPECFLVKNDRMTMAFGIEGRVPFLDHNLVEASFRIPPRMKMRALGRTRKYILKKAMKNVLPKRIKKRGKQVFFVPLDKWIEHDLMDSFESLLSKKTITKQGYFNYPVVRKCFDNYDRSKLFYAKQIWSLVNFQLWHKLYIEKVPLKELSV